MLYNELSQKNRFQSVPIAALCLYNIQPENLVFKKSLSIIIHRNETGVATNVAQNKVFTFTIFSGFIMIS